MARIPEFTVTMALSRIRMPHKINSAAPMFNKITFSGSILNATQSEPIKVIQVAIHLIISFIFIIQLYQDFTYLSSDTVAFLQQNKKNYKGK